MLSLSDDFCNGIITVCFFAMLWFIPEEWYMPAIKKLVDFLNDHNWPPGGSGLRSGSHSS